METYRTTLAILLLQLICSGFTAQLWAQPQLAFSQQSPPNSARLAELSSPVTDYLWLQDQQPNAKAYDALEFIAGAARHGLKPNDYHYDVLQQLNPATSKHTAQQFNQLLTDGLLTLIHDITVGRLDPTVVDPNWAIPREPFNAADFLQYALQVKNFKACLNALIPKSEQYQQIIAAAQRYQTYVDQGGWPEIPPSPLLKPGDSHHNIPVIRARLAFEDNTLNPINSRIFDQNLVQAVKQFQHRHSLKDDGIIGPATLREMNISAAERLQQIRINLERIRWLPADLGERYILVNLANYRLMAVEKNQTKLDMRVIVGKKKRPTPSFASKVTHVVLNPSWYVPHKLARLDLLPKQQSNPNYFAHYNFRVFKNSHGKRSEVDPRAINWQAISKHHFPYSLVQEPGDKNALGRLKFITPNPWSIYLHDTPSKSLFDKTSRNFSSGCIRVEDPYALANFSLAGNNKRQTLLNSMHSDKSHITRLERPLAVYTIYSTVWLNGNELIFSPDSYNRDQKMAKYL